MPCACQNKKRFEVVTTVTDPKTQKTKEKIVFSSQYETTAANVAKRYPGSVVREHDPTKKDTAK